MDFPGASLIRAMARRIAAEPAPSPTPGLSLVKLSPEKRLAGANLERMVGYNAGLPIGVGSVGINDPILKATGAIPLRGEGPQEYQANGTTVRIRGWEQHPVVNACVHAIVDLASRVPLQVYKKKPAKNATGFSDEIELQTSMNPLQQLVDSPNSFLSQQRYRAFLMTHYIIYGNAITYLERPEQTSPDATPLPPTSLRLVHPEDILTVWVNAKGYPLWYMWRDTLGYMHTSPVQDLLHMRDLSAKGFVFGYPRAAAALNDIIGDNEASQYVRQMVTNSGQAGVWLLANEHTTPDEAKKVEDQLHEQLVTRGGRGKLKVMGGIAEVKSVAFDLRELEFPDLRKISREDICASFGVDPRIIGIGSASNDGGLSGVQYIEARQRLAKQAVEPMLTAMESEMNLWLAPEFGDLYLRFDPDALAALVEDRDATSKRMIAEVGAQLRTVEEAREVLDLNPEYDEDDLLVITAGASVVPVMVAKQPPVQLDANGNPIPPDGAAAATPPTDAADEGAQAKPNAKKDKKDEKNLQATEGQNPNNPSQTPKMNDGSEDPKPKRKRVGSFKVNRVQMRGAVLAPATRTMLWQQFDRRATKEEAPYKRQATILFGENRSTVAKVFSRESAAAGENPSREIEVMHINQAKRAVRRYMGPQGESTQRWADRYHPLISGTYANGATAIVDALNKNRATPKAKKGKVPPSPSDASLSYDFDLNNPNVQAAIRGRATRLAEHVNDTTAQTITDAIEIGLEEGMTIDEIARLIDRTTFGTYADTRAMMIARTETIGALNQGEHDTAADSGIVAGKEWLTQGDDRVRDSHYDCEAEGMVGIDDTFDNDMAYPGDPSGDASDVINCRCTLLYYDTLDAGGHSIEAPGEALAAT